jgi:hypothetical protein
MRMRIFLLALAVSVAVLAPAASANSYNLFCGGTACGSVSITNISGGVHVDVTMTGGYTIQSNANSGGFLFNASVSTSSLTLSGFSTVEFGSSTATLTSGVNNGAGKFSGGVVKFVLPNGNTSVSGISFNLLGAISTSSFFANANGNTVSVHYCSPSSSGGISTKCPAPTGFSSGTPSTVPEPGTLSLLGTGLIGLAGVVRRKLLS